MHLRNDTVSFSKLEIAVKSSIFIRISGISIATHYVLSSLEVFSRQLLSVMQEVNKPLWADQRKIFLHGLFMLPQRPHRKRMSLEHTKRTCNFEEQDKYTETFSIALLL